MPRGPGGACPHCLGPPPPPWGRGGRGEGLGRGHTRIVYTAPRIIQSTDRLYKDPEHITKPHKDYTNILNIIQRFKTSDTNSNIFNKICNKYQEPIDNIIQHILPNS